MKVNVIGAGIAGPATALHLATKGHDVTVHERRSQNDLWASSSIGVTTENIQAVENLGARDMPYLPAGSHAISATVNGCCDITQFRDNWTTKYNIVVWGELHQALVDAGERAGVTYRWRVNGDIPDADLVVHAKGVRYAAHHSQFTPAYSVFRGTRYTDAEHGWLAVHSEDKRFVLNVGTTPGQQAWMFYVHEGDTPPLRTEVVTGERLTWMREQAALHIPEQWRETILATRGPVQASPVGDWTLPKMAWWNGADYGGTGVHVDIGDAIIPLRPHTTAGANVGIQDGLTLPDELSRDAMDAWQADRFEVRAGHIQAGKDLGQKWMGA